MLRIVAQKMTMRIYDAVETNAVPFVYKRCNVMHIGHFYSNKSYLKLVAPHMIHIHNYALDCTNKTNNLGFKQ